MAPRSLITTTIAASALLSAPLAATAQQPDAARQGPVVEAARQVTTDSNPTRLFSNPQIAVHPHDPSTIAMVAGDARNGGCKLMVTRDGGLSWATTVDNLLPEGYDHCIQRNYGRYITPVFASDGTLYVGMSGSANSAGHPNSPVPALIAVVEDLGRSHETFVAAEAGDYTYTPEDGPAETGFEQHRYNSLAVDPTNPDRLYMGWRWGVGGVSAPFGVIPPRSLVIVSNDGGRTWSEPIDVLKDFPLTDGEQPHGSDVPMLVVAPDGTAHAFTKERPPRAGDGEPRPAARLFMFSSTDGGETWTTRVIHEGAPYITNPSAAVDPASGALYVVWDARGDEETNPNEVYFMRSTDGGQTWSEAVNLTDDDPAKGFNQYFPGISVAPNGRIDVAWHDFRNDPFFTPGTVGAMGTTEGERWWDVYYTHSTDGGQTWSQNLRVTDRSIDGDVGVTFNNQDFIGPMGVASTNGTALFAWSDSRAGDPAFEAEDAYFTRVRLAAGDGGAATAADSRALWGLLGAGGALALGGLVLLAGTRMARRGRGEEVGEPAPARR